MGQYSKGYYSDIQLMGSGSGVNETIVKDGNGDRISLIHDEWHSINGAARTNRAPSEDNPLVSRDYLFSKIDEAVAEIVALEQRLIQEEPPLLFFVG